MSMEAEKRQSNHDLQPLGLNGAECRKCQKTWDLVSEADEKCEVSQPKLPSIHDLSPEESGGILTQEKGDRLANWWKWAVARTLEKHTTSSDDQPVPKSNTDKSKSKCAWNITISEDHSALAGLVDDDCTQYPFLDSIKKSNLDTKIFFSEDALEQIDGYRFKLIEEKTLVKEDSCEDCGFPQISYHIQYVGGDFGRSTNPCLCDDLEGYELKPEWPFWFKKNS